MIAGDGYGGGGVLVLRDDDGTRVLQPIGTYPRLTADQVRLRGAARELVTDELLDLDLTVRCG